MKFATAILLASMFIGISAHAGEERSCTSGTVGSFTTSQIADMDQINRVDQKAPAANPPPVLPADKGAVRDGN